MKCKRCNGTGSICNEMVICPDCDGYGNATPELESCPFEEPACQYEIAQTKQTPVSAHQKVLEALATIEKYCYNREDSCHNCIFADEFDCPTALEYFTDESRAWLKRKASELERLEEIT